jgi:predicted nuclease of predicted toxin-antitoxin system
VSIRFYLDEHVPRVIGQGMRRRGIDVSTVQDDGATGSDDIAVRERALALGRVVVTNDEDFQVEAARRQRAGESFAGVIYVDLNRITIGRCIGDLEIIGIAGEPSDLANRVEYLPL